MSGDSNSEVMYTTLSQCPLFRGIAREQIQTMIDDKGDCYAVASYPKGAYIAQHDTAYSGLMIILEGEVRGEMVTASGEKITVDTLDAGQLIAPAFLFGSNNRLPFDVIALSDVKIMTLHRGYLFELMQQEMLILSNFIDIVSNRAHSWSKKLSECNAALCGK